MIKFKTMHRLMNIPHIGGDFFKLGMITGIGEHIADLNEMLSLLLKLTSLISFAVFILLNYPRIRVRIAQISKRANRGKRKKSA